jgi:hypothetical protein
MPVPPTHDVCLQHLRCYPNTCQHPRCYSNTCSQARQRFVVAYCRDCIRGTAKDWQHRSRGGAPRGHHCRCQGDGIVENRRPPCRCHENEGNNASLTIRPMFVWGAFVCCSSAHWLGGAECDGPNVTNALKSQARPIWHQPPRQSCWTGQSRSVCACTFKFSNCLMSSSNLRCVSRCAACCLRDSAKKNAITNEFELENQHYQTSSN